MCRLAGLEVRNFLYIELNISHLTIAIESSASLSDGSLSDCSGKFFELLAQPPKFSSSSSLKIYPLETIFSIGPGMRKRVRQNCLTFNIVTMFCQST